MISAEDDEYLNTKEGGSGRTQVHETGLQELGGLRRLRRRKSLRFG